MKSSKVFLVILLVSITLLNFSVAENTKSKTTTTTAVSLKEDQVSGATEDDFNESTDIVRTSSSSSQTTRTGEDLPPLDPDEELLGEVVEEDGAATTETETRVIETKLPDGKIQRQTVTSTVTTRPTRIRRTVRKKYFKTVNIESISEAMKGFDKLFLNVSLSEQELALFNAIALTNGNNYTYKYNYMQLTRDNLLKVLEEKVVPDFYVSLDESDVQKLVTEIKECKDRVVMHNFDTSSIEYARKDSWKVAIQFLMATCNPEIPVVQLFAISAYKTGSFIQGQYSEPNFATIKLLTHRWLLETIPLMFHCNCKNSETCTENSGKNLSGNNGHLGIRRMPSDQSVMRSRLFRPLKQQKQLIRPSAHK